MSTEMTDAVTLFAERRGLELTEVVRFEELLIRSMLEAHVSITDGYAELPDSAHEEGAIAILLQMLHRNFEHVEAAIVSFVTGGGSSAEVVARASIELSTSIGYVLIGDRPARVGAWFAQHVSDVDAQIARWEASVATLAGADLAIHQAAIAQRKAGAAALRHGLQLLGLPDTEKWPRTVAERFAAMGDHVCYRTVYARMSSEAHGDAEATLLYVLAKVSPLPGAVEAIALESINTSRFYVWYAAHKYLRTCVGYAIAYGLPRRGALEALCAPVHKELLEITRHIGAGISLDIQ